MKARRALRLRVWRLEPGVGPLGSLSVDSQYDDEAFGNTDATPQPWVSTTSTRRGWLGSSNSRGRWGKRVAEALEACSKGSLRRAMVPVPCDLAQTTSSQPLSPLRFGQLSVEGGKWGMSGGAGNL
jgi:hypothetical protein